MNRTFRAPWLVAALTCTIAPLAVAVDDLLTLLPEKTTLAVSATDLKAVEKLEDHAVVKVIGTPELKKAFAPAIGKWTEQLESFEKYWKEEAGLNNRDLQDLFAGGIAVGMTLDPESMKSEISAGKSFSDVIDDVEAPVAIVAHFGGDEAKADDVVKALMRSSSGEEGKKDEPPLVFPDDYNSVTDDDHGVKLHIITPKKERKNETMAWALNDKVLITTNSEKNLRSMLDRARNGGSSLATAPQFKEVATRAKGSDVVFYAHIQPWIKTGLSTALERSEKGDPEPGAPDFGKIAAVLGIDQFESVYGMANTKENAVDVEFGVTFQKKPGILKLLSSSGPGKAPEFLAPDLKNGSYGTFDWAQCMTDVQDMLQEAMPTMNMMLEMQLGEIRTKTGVDIKKGLLGSFGSNYWSAADALEAKRGAKTKKDDDLPVTPEAAPQVIGIELKGQKAFDLALTSILNYVAPGQGLFEKVEYQGYTLNQFKSSPIPVVYVTTEDWFIFSVGPRTLLEKILTRLSKGGNQDNLFTQPHVVSAIRALPAGGVGTTYTDLGSMLETVLTLARQVPSSELEEFMNVEALPEHISLPLALSSRFYNEANSVRFRLHIEEKAK